MLTAVRELPVPLLAALLLGRVMTKAWRVLRARSIAAAMDPAGLFPLRLRGPMVAAAAPADVWREGCWRFVVCPGVARDRRVDIVFAVYLQARRPPIRVAVLDEILGRPVLAAASLN
jgi:hypothetical protein